MKAKIIILALCAVQVRQYNAAILLQTSTNVLFSIINFYLHTKFTQRIVHRKDISFLWQDRSYRAERVVCRYSATVRAQSCDKKDNLFVNLI